VCELPRRDYFLTWYVPGLSNNRERTEEEATSLNPRMRSTSGSAASVSSTAVHTYLACRVTFRAE
jgi:hypothetical protein